jgi:hypothetical protein
VPSKKVINQTKPNFNAVQKSMLKSQTKMVSFNANCGKTRTKKGFCAKQTVLNFTTKQDYNVKLIGIPNQTALQDREELCANAYPDCLKNAHHIDNVQK